MFATGTYLVKSVCALRGYPERRMKMVKGLWSNPIASVLKVDSIGARAPRLTMSEEVEFGAN